MNDPLPGRRRVRARRNRKATSSLSAPRQNYTPLPDRRVAQSRDLDPTGLAFFHPGRKGLPLRRSWRRMLDPFKLMGRLFVAAFRIIAYTLVCTVQVSIYLSQGHPEKVGDALGDLGRGTTDALADICGLDRRSRDQTLRTHLSNDDGRARVFPSGAWFHRQVRCAPSSIESMVLCRPLVTSRERRSALVDPKPLVQVQSSPDRHRDAHSYQDRHSREARHMPAMKCIAAGCGKTELSGKRFLVCKKCGAHFCSDHGSAGKKCPKNCGGYLG